ncbi:unnamed protein product, partial [marine sediment metagenome]
DLPALYSGAVCFVYPSVYEGFGLPVLEAMACGTPVIGSNTTSLPEVIGDAGLLCDPLDFNDISSSMEKIIDNEILREELIQRGLERVKQFSWDVSAKTTWLVLNQARDEISHQ